MFIPLPEQIHLFLIHRVDKPSHLVKLQKRFLVRYRCQDRRQPDQYLITYKALKIWMDYPIQNKGVRVCAVSQLRFILMLQEAANHDNLIMPELRKLAAHDEKKKTQYCETLYWYLAYGHSLKKTCDMLFTHRNTVCYRIRKL